MLEDEHLDLVQSLKLQLWKNILTIIFSILLTCNDINPINFQLYQTSIIESLIEPDQTLVKPRIHSDLRSIFQSLAFVIVDDRFGQCVEQWRGFRLANQPDLVTFGAESDAFDTALKGNKIIYDL